MVNNWSTINKKSWFHKTIDKGEIVYAVFPLKKKAAI